MEQFGMLCKGSLPKKSTERNRKMEAFLPKFRDKNQVEYKNYQGTAEKNSRSFHC